MGLFGATSHSFVRFPGRGTTVLLSNKRSGREVQPLAALYPTVRLSPWRQVQKNIYSRVWTPSPTWSVLHLGGLGDMGLTPVQGGYPRYHLFCLPTGGLLSWSPLPLDLSASLPTEFCHYLLCVFCVVPGMEPVYETTTNWKSFINWDFLI